MSWSCISPATISRSKRNFQQNQMKDIITYNLKTSIRVELANVSSMEPALAISIYFKFLSCFFWILEITLCYIWTPNDNLSSRIGLISDGIVSWKNQKQKKKVCCVYYLSGQEPFYKLFVLLLTFFPADKLNFWWTNWRSHAAYCSIPG